MIFEAPILGFAALALPLLWWLFKQQPSAPLSIQFPALMLVKITEEQQPESAPPWWLIALRMVIASIIILASAGPIYKPLPVSETNTDSLLIIDNGWSAASHWTEIKNAALEAVRDRNSTRGKIYIAFTAQPFSPIEGLTPSLARAAIDRMTAQAWPSNRGLLAAALPRNISNTVWISDGLEDGGSAKLLSVIKMHGKLRIVMPVKPTQLVLKNVTTTADGYLVSITRPPNLPRQSFGVSMIASDGSVTAYLDMAFPVHSTLITGTLLVPPGARNTVFRISIDGEKSAAATYLLGSNAQRSYVGIISAYATGEKQPFKAMDYYLERALQSHADIKRATLGATLNAGVNILMLADIGQLPQEDNKKLSAWIDKGGMMVLFAGPRLAESGSAFTPVTLRRASRTLGGAMSWQKPLSFGVWPAASPFAGLKQSPDVIVREQVLADPTADLTGHIWATLSDGTPIVTAAKHGRGMVVLVHTTANAAWSTLALSGMFEEMLVRLLTLAQTTSTLPNTATPEAQFTLAQSLLYDGSLAQPTTLGTPIKTDAFADVKPGPSTPPGLYTAGAVAQALNLGTILPPPMPIVWPGDVVRDGVQESSTVLMPWLFGLAALLFMLEWLIVLVLQGHIKRLAKLLTLVAAMFGMSHAKAAEPAGALDVRLAYVTSRLSATSASGLSALSDALKMRTAADMGAPVAVNPDRTSLGLYAMVYWPVTADTAPLSTIATQRVLRYLEGGGLILFDTNEQNSTALRQILLPLDLPRLERLSPDHVLAHSFYLLGRVPSGFDFGTQWVESGTLGASGRTTSIVLSINGNWAAAWANGNEAALRYGVNLVIYALSGTYKADQVHAASLLERMSKAKEPR